jgi:hypothetical protein
METYSRKTTLHMQQATGTIERILPKYAIWYSGRVIRVISADELIVKSNLIYSMLATYEERPSFVA